jgi:hypothetical protein
MLGSGSVDFKLLIFRVGLFSIDKEYPGLYLPPTVTLRNPYGLATKAWHVRRLRMGVTACRIEG